MACCWTAAFANICSPGFCCKRETKRLIIGNESVILVSSAEWPSVGVLKLQDVFRQEVLELV